MAEIAKVLAENIRRLRNAKGFTQEQLAEKSNLSMGTIQGYEGCRRWPERPYLEAMAKALGVSETEFFKSNEEKKSSGEIDSILELLSLWGKSSDSTKEHLLFLLRSDTEIPSKAKRRS